MNASGVSLMPAFAASPLSLLRVSSSSVMSASSICQTCGTLSQLACRRGPEIFWMRPSGLTSIAPNFEKSTSGTFGSAPPPAGAPLVERLLDPGFHVVGRDAPFEARAFDAAQIDAELARELAHRRARVSASRSPLRRWRQPERSTARWRLRGAGRGAARGASVACGGARLLAPQLRARRLGRLAGCGSARQAQPAPAAASLRRRTCASLRPATITLPFETRSPFLTATDFDHAGARSTARPSSPSRSRA